MNEINIKSKLKQLTNNKCEMCFKIENLKIHHIDKNFQNNDIFNLILLCSKCHYWSHIKENEGKICVNCHKKYKPINKNQLYCSEPCRRKAREILEAGTNEEFKLFQELKQQIMSKYKQPKFFTKKTNGEDVK